MADPTTLDTARAALQAERVQLLQQIDELTDGGDIHLDFDENFADSAQVAAEKGENKALAGQLREQLDDVEAALRRLDAGTYGTCEHCQGAIGEDRLEAIPTARDCISCAA